MTNWLSPNIWIAPVHYPHRKYKYRAPGSQTHVLHAYTPMQKERVGCVWVCVGVRGGGSFLLQLIFLKYFIWILAAVVLQKTKGNEPCVPEPKTTYSVRKSCCSCCSQHSEKQSQSKLLKTARGYVKHKGGEMSWWNDIWVVAGDRLASHTAKQVKYKTQVVLLLNDS